MQVPPIGGVDLAGAPLFTAGATQPITAPVGVITAPTNILPGGGYMVIAGTGKFYEVNDITTTATQAVYGIWDQLPFGAATIPAGSTLTDKTRLVQQTVGPAQLSTNGETYFAISQNTVDYKSASPKRGYWIDLPNSGQRNVYPVGVLTGGIGQVDTISPSNVSLDPCANPAAGTGYLYAFLGLTGAGLSGASLDTNGDGNIDGSDLVVSGLQGKADGRNVTLRSGSDSTGDRYVIISGGKSSADQLFISCKDKIEGCLTLAPSKIKTREWRQLFLR